MENREIYVDKKGFSIRSNKKREKDNEGIRHTGVVDKCRRRNKALKLEYNLKKTLRERKKKKG
jgi:predicted GIY-YIG superfamily endonuclease